MKNTLLDKGIILPSGEINKDKINLVAGAITQPFAEMVWETTGGDMETVNRLTDVLVTMNTPTDREKLFKIIKMLFGLMGLPFSEEAEPMDAEPDILEYFIFYLSKKEKSNTDLSNNHSIPILSPNPSPLRENAAEPERKGTEAADAYSVYEEIIKDNIEYEHFIKHTNIDRERLDEIVSLILETVCTKRKTIRIAGDDYPAELVKAKFMKLNSSHIAFAFDCMKENTTKIRNIKQYLKAVLFNAPNTIDSYYTALVNHDMYGGY